MTFWICITVGAIWSFFLLIHELMVVNAKELDEVGPCESLSQKAKQDKKP